MGRAGNARGPGGAEVFGVRIPAEDVPHIVECFCRARNAAQAAGGLASGWSVPNSSFEQHGGTIQVTTTEGAGSTFIVRLPV